MPSPETSQPGDFLIIRVNQPSLSTDLIDFFKEFKPIGVHFGKEAFLHDAHYENWMSAYDELRTSIKDATGRNVMVWALDHEGGRVHRTPPHLAHFPYPLNWEGQSGEVGKVFGEQLRSLGINMLFGPCLDIFSNPENTVIGPRAFGKTAVEVDEYSSPFIQALEERDIAVTLKHFPGHGHTKEDSHTELPISQKNWNELCDNELVPFQFAINGGAMAVMLAHILFPEVDEKFPSSLSPKFGKDLLRDTLQFQYVSVTDDLDMRAIKENYTPTQIAEQLIQSEVNFALFNHDLEHAAHVAEALTPLLKEHDNKLETIQARTAHFINYIDQPEVTELPRSTLKSHLKTATSIPDIHHT